MITRIEYKHLDVIVNTLYYSVIILIIVSCGLVLWNYLKAINNLATDFLQDISYLLPIGKTGLYLIFLIIFVVLGLIVDSLQRVKKFSVGTLVISKKKMYYLLFAFGLFTVSFVLGFVAINAFGHILHTKIWVKKLRLSIEAISILLLGVSELPILHILSILVTLGEKDTHEGQVEKLVVDSEITSVT